MLWTNCDIGSPIDQVPMSVFRTKLCSIGAAVNWSQLLAKSALPLAAIAQQQKASPSCLVTQNRCYRKKIDVSHLAPLKFDYSEDLVTQETLNPSDVLFKYRDIPEVNELPEYVRKLFTVEFASSREKLEHRNMMLQEKVTDLVGAVPCLEKQVAYLTVKIRNLIPHCVGDRRNKYHKAYLIERIAQRKKILGYLRQLDYDRFIWLLKELKLSYTPYDKYAYHKLSRKALIKKEVREGMLDEKQQKIEDVRKRFEKEKQDFMVYKQKLLDEIDADIKTYDLDKTDVLKRYQAFMDMKQMEVKKSAERPKMTKKVADFDKIEKAQRERDSKVFP